MKAQQLIRPSGNVFRTKYVNTVNKGSHSSITGVTTMTLKDEHEYHLKKNRYYAVVTRNEGIVMFHSEHEGECFQWMGNVKNGERKEYTVLRCYRKDNGNE